ncbi:MAG TPA: hypothetical protein VEK84_11375 [Terriglobales bacterium]|nr:hypothetical protein [Terriglobales bacterium]
MNSPVFARVAISIVAILLGLTTSAQAGPPLICHPIEIGHAKSLPWVDWTQKGSGGYDLKNLTRDTLAILDPSAPVLVRMETLRRATLYARQDPQVAKELLTRLHARAANSDAAGHPEALAWFDVGYLAETYKQWIRKGEPNPAAGLDGYAWVKKAIGLRGQDPEMEFAAALVTLSGPESDHREHVLKAMAGAKNDPILARNLVSSFNRQTISELLTNAPAGGFNK